MLLGPNGCGKSTPLKILVAATAFPLKLFFYAAAFIMCMCYLNDCILFNDPFRAFWLFRHVNILENLSLNDFADQQYGYEQSFILVVDF
ncbi:hypothetical protein Gogos_001775 [Gossypium gossypioides]|uniref:ABC transporter domain-containing protein n=1 Tax=Gossypium gossypioides TaxID=34282 RepID=A0A7J9CPN2_GOSGO|nr:hypothetical protein [Gossypium gossypioides]